MALFCVLAPCTPDECPNVKAKMESEEEVGKVTCFFQWPKFAQCRETADCRQEKLWDSEKTEQQRGEANWESIGRALCRTQSGGPNLCWLEDRSGAKKESNGSSWSAAVLDGGLDWSGITEIETCSALQIRLGGKDGTSERIYLESHSSLMRGPRGVKRGNARRVPLLVKDSLYRIQSLRPGRRGSTELRSAS